jgi:hypothetical protein
MLNIYAIVLANSMASFLTTRRRRVAIFKGDTAQCFRHYATTLPRKGSRNVSKSRKILADFCGVSLGTTEHWLIRNGRQKGLPLLKLRFFLELRGYEVSELEALKKDKVFYQLAEMIAYNTIGIEEARVHLGFVDLKSVFRLASGGFRTTLTRLGKIETLWEKHKDFVSRSRREWQNRMRLVVSPSTEETPVVPVVTLQTQSGEPLELGRNTELEMLTYLILAMGPLAAKVASGRYTAEDRKEIRRLTGGAVSRLSDSLIQLSSETSRERFLASSTNGKGKELWRLIVSSFPIRDKR